MIAHPVETAVLRSVNHTVYDEHGELVSMEAGSHGGELREGHKRGYVLFLKDPIEVAHESERWTFWNESRNTISDLRPHICLLSRNVVIQGDEDSDR